MANDGNEQWKWAGKQTKTAVPEIVEACFAVPESRSNYPAFSSCSPGRFLSDLWCLRWARALTGMSKLVTLHTLANSRSAEPEESASSKRCLRESLDCLHVGGGPLTYLSIRWKLRGILLLRWHGGSRATQIRQASRVRAAARRR